MLPRGAIFTPQFPAATFIAAGACDNAGTVDLAGAGAAVGDFMVIVSPYNAVVTPSGGGAGSWTSATFTWQGGTYTGDVESRVLASASGTVSVSGGSGGWCWAIYRGPTSAAKVTSEESGAASHTVTWPAPADSAMVQLLISHYQVTPGTGVGATAPGYTSRVSNGPNIFHFTILEQLYPASGAVTVTAGTTADLYIGAIELRGYF